ncbi:MAG: nitrate reductase cytochrome c-type subunit [Candidatus Thiodiazotropha sp. (ex Lucinoma annulata)]|nr:nitrate reductase cytochrome c-type subunit [Candidatus Thiodiazotropha sp. (ex Lucinoma annulata)]
MNKMVPILMFLALLLVTLSIPVTAEETTVHLTSLRGGNDLDSESVVFANKRRRAMSGGFEVSFEDQPPLIPHNIDKTRISAQENSCLKCHTKEDAKVENAVRPPKSHYYSRGKMKGKSISPRRYFCTQCHVPQIDAPALVKNNYKN